jgi:hypothetical protein
VKHVFKFIDSSQLLLDSGRSTRLKVSPAFSLLWKSKAQTLFQSNHKGEIFYSLQQHLVSALGEQAPVKYGLFYLAGKGVLEAKREREARKFVGDFSSLKINPFLHGAKSKSVTGFSPFFKLPSVNVFGLSSYSELNYGYNNFSRERLFSAVNYIYPVFYRRVRGILRKRGYYVLLGGLRFFLRRFFFFIIPRKFLWIRRYFLVAYRRFSFAYLLLKQVDFTALSIKVIRRLFYILFYAYSLVKKGIRRLKRCLLSQGFYPGKVTHVLLNLNFLFIKVFRFGISSVLSARGAYLGFSKLVLGQVLSRSGDIAHLLKSFSGMSAFDMWSMSLSPTLQLKAISKHLPFVFSTNVRVSNKRLAGVLLSTNSSVWDFSFLQRGLFNVEYLFGFQYNPHLVKNTLTFYPVRKRFFLKRKQSLHNKRKLSFFNRVVDYFQLDKGLKYRLSHIVRGRVRLLRRRTRIRRLCALTILRKRLKGSRLFYVGQKRHWMVALFRRIKRGRRRRFAVPRLSGAFVPLTQSTYFRRLALLSEVPAKSWRRYSYLRLNIKRFRYSRYLGFKPYLISPSRVKIKVKGRVRRLSFKPKFKFLTKARIR